MSPDLSGFSFFFGISVIFIPFILWGIIAASLWIGFRQRGLEAPKWKHLLAIAFLQTLLGFGAVYGVELARVDLAWMIGAGLGVMLLSGLLFIKLLLNLEWRRSLRGWVLASLLQLLFVPACSWAMLMGWLRPISCSTHPSRSMDMPGG